MSKTFLVYDPDIKDVIYQYRLYKKDILVLYTSNNIIKRVKKHTKLMNYNITMELLNEV